MDISTRERRDDDLPELVSLLAEQQPGSSYPIRWPLPFPVEDFVVRRGELAAWVAEEAGPDGPTLLGHVSVLVPGSDEVGDALRAAAAPVGDRDLGVVSVLFTSTAARGRGVGALLLELATGWTRRRGLLPVLDVVPTHAAAAGLYRSRGWTEIGTARPAWLDAGRPDLLLLVAPPA